MLPKKQLDFNDVEKVEDVILDFLVSLTEREIKFEKDEILKIGMIIGIICRNQEDEFSEETKEKLKIITSPFYGDQKEEEKEQEGEAQ